MNKFIYIQPHIVGNLESWSTCYSSDLVEKDSRDEAQRYGEKVLEHDDFFVGELNNGVVVALYSDKRKRRSKKELEDVNREFGLELKEKQ